MAGPIRVDWQAIKARWGSEVSEFHLALVPKGFAQLVLAIQERLHWQATYRIEDYDFSDWDQLQEIVDMGLAGLTDTMRLSDLIGYVDEIETLLLALQNQQSILIDCCENIGATGETVGDPGIIFEVGDPPLTWGDGEPVADWDDWHQLVCGAAHNYVDQLKEMGDEINTWLSLGSIAIGIVALMLGAAAGAGIVLTIGYATAASVVTGLLQLVGGLVFVNVSDDIEVVRDDLVCAIVEGSAGQMANIIEGAIDSAAWLAWYQYVDYASARNVMLEGSHGSEHLGVSRSTDCNCVCTEVLVTNGTRTGTFTFASALNGGNNNHEIQIRWNWNVGANAYCGAQVMFDSCVLSHNVTRLRIVNQAGGVVYDNTTACGHNGSQAVGRTGSNLYVSVNDADATCGTPFTMTVTWHEV